MSYYQFENFNRLPGVAHGVFARRAGHSKGPFQSLNIARGIGDEDRNIDKNRRIIARCFDADKLIFTEQVHAEQVLVIDRRNTDSSDADKPSTLIGDALVTDLRQTYLVIQVADCQAVMLVDPNRQVVANVHVGWRGTIKNILGCTITTMVTRFGCRAHDLFAGIGPALGPCCAEFINYRTEIPEEFWAYKDNLHHFDFWAISRDQLVAGGVSPEKIAVSRICTKCSTDIFYSYRGEGITGRFAAVIGLR